MVLVILAGTNGTVHGTASSCYYWPCSGTIDNIRPIYLIYLIWFLKDLYHQRAYIIYGGTILALYYSGTI